MSSKKFEYSATDFKEILRKRSLEDLEEILNRLAKGETLSVEGVRQKKKDAS